MKSSFVVVLLSALLLTLAGNFPTQAQESEEPDAAPVPEPEDKETGATKESAKPEEVTDPWVLYRKEGRKWRVRNTTKLDGMDDRISHIQYEVIEVGESYCILQTTLMDENAEPRKNIPAQEARIEFTGAKGDSEESAEEPGRETVTVEAGEFECYVTEAGGTKTWSSVKYPGLTVKSKGKFNELELVMFDEKASDKETTSESGEEQDEGKSADVSDYWENYKSTFKVGRKWVYSGAAGIRIENEVIKVENDTAVVKVTTTMNGNQLGDPTESEYDLSEDSGQGDVGAVEWQEKEIECKAGTFVCISTGGNMWFMKKHPIIIVKSTGLELTEFND